MKPTKSESAIAASFERALYGEPTCNSLVYRIADAVAPAMIVGGVAAIGYMLGNCPFLPF